MEHYVGDRLPGGEADAGESAKMAVRIGRATRPQAGKNVCVSRCGQWFSGARIVLAVTEGQGHGEEAARNAEAALSCIGKNLDCACEEMFASCDARLVGTRGAALAVTIIEPDVGRMTIASVGNIRALLLRKSCDLRLYGGSGSVGAGYHNLVPETLALHDGNVLAMFSNGIEKFPMLRGYFGDRSVSAQGQAEAILEHCSHAADDATVLIYRHET
ncbi:MAG TPA: SpoIIE family protein phosphatase [Gallionella sp.]|nr:SpoIIE family protein phosphatase [Gallionella sp.]